MQPVPEKMRLEMVIGMKIEILDGHQSVFSNGSFEKRPEFWPWNILNSIPMTISALILSGAGCSIVEILWPKYL